MYKVDGTIGIGSGEYYLDIVFVYYDGKENVKEHYVAEKPVTSRDQETNINYFKKHNNGKNMDSRKFFPLYNKIKNVYKLTDKDLV